MSTFAAYAADFEFCSPENAAGRHLVPLFSNLDQVDFQFHVANPKTNQGQMTADFDDRLADALHAAGAARFQQAMPKGIRQQLDFSFSHQGKIVAVEIEKENREKVLRDLLKCHLYLQSGADLAVIFLPRNYPHSKGVWDLFAFGCDRYRECLKYGMGTPESLGRILLVGYTQHDATTGEKLSTVTRVRMRKLAQVAEDWVPWALVILGRHPACPHGRAA